MTEHAVVIAGGGPTGLMLAAELALARVDVAIVERRPDQELAGSRAGGLQARTIELLDQRGLADRFLAVGKPMPAVPFATIMIALGDLPTRHPYGLAIWQNETERLLAGWVEELGVPIYRKTELTGFVADDAGVDITCADRSLRAGWLVGCDGGRSLVRRTANIEFTGWDASVSYLIAEAELAGEPAVGLRRDAIGTYAIGPIEGGHRIVLRDARVERGEPTLDDLRAALLALYGTDYGLRSVKWISRFSDATRQAARYRAGRVLLAGDAAHIHSPIGGQGLNLGIQDAVNLGWKLARVVHGESGEPLLDTYHAERHPAGARVLRATMAATALARGDDRSEALRETMGELLALDEPRRQRAAFLAGLDVRYELGEGHPLLGRRMPDLDLETADGPRRVFELLRNGRPLLLDFTNCIPGYERLAVKTATAVPGAVLVRPDGHVAWTGDDDTGLAAALAF